MSLEDGIEDETPIETTGEVLDTGTEPVVETVAEPVKTEPKTMEDSIRDKLRELNTPPKDENEGKAGFVKDPVTGRFVKGVPKAAVDPKAVVKPVDSKAADGVAAPAVADPKAAVTDTKVPPSSWNAAARAEYAKLPPAVQAQVHKREADFHAGIAQYKSDAGMGREIMADFAPYMPTIRAMNTTPKQLVQGWTNVEYQLHQAQTPEAKAQVILKLSKAYGVENKHFGIAEAPAVGADGNPIVAAQVDPAVRQLEDRVAALTKHLETNQTAQARIEYTKIEDEIKGFAQTAGHEHFEAVRHDMSALMETGRAKDLQDAYNKAIWSNDEVRAILLEQQRVDELNKTAERAAAAKRAASANVAPRGTPPVKVAKAGAGTMDDTIRATFRAIQARSAA